MTASMDSTLASSMTQVICSFLMPKPTGTSFAAQAPPSVSWLGAEPSLCTRMGSRAALIAQSSLYRHNAPSCSQAYPMALEKA